MDSRYLRLALNEAEVRRGMTCPNPAVGAVLVRGDEVVGSGHHWGVGYPHAEVAAVERAAERARGATLYVTLEPCCHWGRTPPCTGLIREAGIARVIFGYRDPNPKVSGGGEAELRRAGIACERLDLPEVAAFYEAYHHWTRTGLPFVTAKLAVSLDGKIAGSGGPGRLRLTGDAAAERTHRARKQSDAILTTARTVIADDPRLDARLGEKTIAKPVLILDRRGELPLGARLWSTAKALVVFHGPEAPADRVGALRDRGAECVVLGETRGKLSLPDALRAAGNRGYHSLWVEGGGRLFSSLLDGPYLNRAWIYVAPVAVGDGLGAFAGAQVGLSRAKRVHWSTAGVDAVGEFYFGE